LVGVGVTVGVGVFVGVDVFVGRVFASNPEELLTAAPALTIPLHKSKCCRYCSREMVTVS
jgi:hypothetical protein